MKPAILPKSSIAYSAALSGMSGMSGITNQDFLSPGYAFRLWADELAGADGSTFSSWAGGPNLTISTAGTPLNLTYNGIGTKKAATFGGGNNLVGMIASQLSSHVTFYQVIQLGAVSTNQVWMDDGAAPTHRMSTDNISQIMNSASSDFPTTGVPTLTTPMVVVMDFNAGSSSIRINGLQISAGTANCTGMTSLRLGCLTGDSSFFTGKIAFLSAYDGGRTSGQILADEATLMAYYGIQSSATNYAQNDYTDGVSGKAYRLLRPNGLADGTSAPLIIYCHGAGGDKTFLTLDLHLHLLSYLCAAGYRVVASDLESQGWGNAASLLELVQLRTAVATKVTSSKTMLWGESMGSLTALLSLADATNWSDVIGYYGVYPVCNLASMFGNNAGAFAVPIRAAYGIAADGSDYATKTSGHDPALLAASAFNGRRMQFSASSDDNTVDRTTNADQMATLVSGHALENTVLSKTNGGHGAPIYYATPAEIVALFNRC